jgi:hypothetical protein
VSAIFLSAPNAAVGKVPFSTSVCFPEKAAGVAAIQAFCSQKTPAFFKAGKFSDQDPIPDAFTFY